MVLARALGAQVSANDHRHRIAGVFEDPHVISKVAELADWKLKTGTAAKQFLLVKAGTPVFLLIGKNHQRERWLAEAVFDPP